MLKTAQVDGGTTRVDGRTLTVTGGYVDPRTGEGRITHRGGRVVNLRRIVRVRTSGLTSKVTFRGGRTRLRLAQLLFEGGTTTLTPPSIPGVQATGGTFTLTGGRLDARTLRGTLGHTGSLTLTRGALRIEALELALELPSTAAVQVWDFRAPMLALAGVNRTLRGHRAAIDVTATLTDGAAAELNESLETDVFRPGMPFGTVAVRGRLRG